MSLEKLSEKVASYCKEINELMDYRNSENFDLDTYMKRANELLKKKQKIYDGYEKLKMKG